MMQTKGREVTLSIETAINGGSLALIEDKRQIDAWTGERQISKAEDLLEQIAELLLRNKIEKGQIKLICVSKGIGSLTGEKIGLSIAKGLSKAFNCLLIKLSLLDALLSKLGKDFQGQVITAVPTGKDWITWQIKEKKGSVYSDVTDTFRSSTEDFYRMLNTSEIKHLIICQSFSEFFIDLSLIENKSIIVANQNPAAIIGINTNSLPARCVR